MYLLQAIVVVVFVFFIPAMALKPKLACQPKTALAIPFVSVAVVLLIQSALSVTGTFSPAAVQVITLILAITAATRLWITNRVPGQQTGWSAYSTQVLLIALALCIYFSPMLLVYGFDKDDEIYSWNMWAIQYFLGEPIDFSYTRAPYPQLFPKILSYSYMLLGGIEFQTATKTALIVFPFIVFSALGLAPARNRYIYLAIYIFLSLFLLREVDLKHRFDDGMPDTMMAVGVLLSVFYFLQFSKDSTRVDYLWLSVICSAVAALTKQPALVWSVASMPLLLAYAYIRKEMRFTHLLIGTIPAIVGIIWILTEGRDFHDNAGVTGRSFAERGYIDQLVFSFKLYFVSDWKLSALYILGTISCIVNRRMLGVLLLFTLPSTITWLLFANYDIRAGLPAILTMPLFLAYSGYIFGHNSKSEEDVKFRLAVLAVLSIFLTIFALSDALSSIEKHRKKKDPGFELGHPLRNNFVRMFPHDADKIYKEIVLDEDSRIWAPTHYVYGLFYGYTNVTRPAHSNRLYSAEELLQELRSTRRNFVTNSGEVPAGPGGMVLDKLVNETCPSLFQIFSGPGNDKDVTIYKLDSELLHSNYCEP